MNSSGLAYHALYAWAQEHGHESRGLVREIYVNDPANVRPDALHTGFVTSALTARARRQE